MSSENCRLCGSPTNQGDTKCMNCGVGICLDCLESKIKPNKSYRCPECDVSQNEIIRSSVDIRTRGG